MARWIAIASLVTILALVSWRPVAAVAPGCLPARLSPLYAGASALTDARGIPCSGMAAQHALRRSASSAAPDGFVETLVSRLTAFFKPWQKFYRKSRPLSTAVIAAHLLALLFGGGLAIAADRVTLRTPITEPEARRRALEGMQTTHRPVLVALVVLFVSGIGLAAADIETFVTSPVFAVKLLLIGVLLGNGLVLARTESTLRTLGEHADGEPRLWRRLRTTARFSIVLWAATVLVGTVLVNMV